ncbi:MAG: NAD(P)H-binding protein [Solirubrobacteraceae bacterium]
MNILVTGITGYVGSRLAPRLQREGHVVRGLTRDPARARARAGAELELPLVTGDAVSGAGLEQALEGIDVAYFLIHSMEPATDGPFETRERVAAENFTAAARAAGVARIVYLGGLVPASGPASAHIASRLAVERILLAGSPDAVAFRASIVIGAHSRSFRFLVRLVERMPVLVVPAWRSHLTQPIDERDVIELLARAATNREVGGLALDIGGPDIVSYGELIGRISHHMLVSRPVISFRRLTVTPIASRISALIAGEQPELIGPLMESLGEDLVLRDDRAAELLGVRLHSLDAAIERALRDWEAGEALAAR